MFAFLNVLSPWHILLILVIALLLFGNRLPEVARSIGRAFNEFKRGLRDVGDELREDDREDSTKHLPPADKWREGGGEASGQKLQPPAGERRETDSTPRESAQSATRSDEG